MDCNNKAIAGRMDDEIAHKAHMGDKISQEILLLKYKNLVKSIAKAYNIAGADYEDIIQEGMIGLYKAIRDFDITKGVYFHVFAKTCINRQIITAVRTAARKKHAPLNESISFDNHFVEAELNFMPGNRAESNNPEKILLAKERQELIQEMIEKLLTQKEKQVLELYLKGSSYKEMAAKIGITEKGISSTIHRIKRKLLTKGTNVL